MDIINVGIIGFGTVGAGVVETLLKNGDLIAKRTGVKPVVSKIADLDIETDRGVTVDKGVLTTDANDVLQGEDVDVVIELVGGTTVARKFILEALKNGKPVVTANKALLAQHGDEIFEAAAQSGADVYYEASVAGGIPIIKAMREGLVGNAIEKIAGIMNGTCNFILTKMETEGTPFDVVLAEAQEAGYAEADPTLDIGGFDTAHKASILASLAYGEWYGMDPVYIEGVETITVQDIEYARELGYKIKLLAIIKRIENDIQIRVHPALIPADCPLAHINDVVNAVTVKGDTVGDTMYTGLGAGRQATASAVVADIVDVGLNIKFNSHSRVAPFRGHTGEAQAIEMNKVRTRYYIRLLLQNTPGVLAKIAGILGNHDISIASVTQKENIGEDAPVVILTEEALEADMQTALQEISNTDVSKQAPMLLRIEDAP